MKTKIQFIDCQPSVDKRNHINEKIVKLEERFDLIIDGKIIIRHDKHDKMKNVITEIHYTIPHNSIYAEGAGENILLSCDRAFFAIQQQLEKHKKLMVHGHTTPLT